MDIFNCFSKGKNFIRQNKLNREFGDPGPEVGGPNFWSLQFFFQRKKFMKQNKINNDPGPEVGGGRNSYR